MKQIVKKISYHKRRLKTRPSRSRTIGNSIKQPIMVSPIDPNFRSINIILLICIAVLAYEVYILVTQQSDMLATLQALNEKLADIETAQQSDMLATLQALNEKLAETKTSQQSDMLATLQAIQDLNEKLIEVETEIEQNITKNNEGINFIAEAATLFAIILTLHVLGELIQAI